MPRKPPTSGRAAGKQPRAARATAPATHAGQSVLFGVLPFLTVGIGASAGGLQAFTSFLNALPIPTGMAFVLIQHLDPNHESLLVNLLASHTTMPVVEAVNGMPLMPDTAFVIPPNATMTIQGGRLVVSSPAPARADRHPIDSFFLSLAEDQRHHAVAVVLSGAGTDGSHSLAAIKQRGGLILAQAEVDGQPMAGMPHSALATGYVDQVLPIEAMPARLLAHQIALRGAPPRPDDDDAPVVDPEHFAELCVLLRNRTGHDFSQYKRPTLLRRIHRRSKSTSCSTRC